jgi:hypothetical protein
MAHSLDKEAHIKNHYSVDTDRLKKVRPQK